jgi:hypothetical protein
MQDIIKPIDRALLKAELTGDKKLRRTNKSNNEIYIVTAHDSPNVMQEIGRLRETAFRSISTNTIRWTMLTANLSCGALKTNRF